MGSGQRQLTQRKNPRLGLARARWAMLSTTLLWLAVPKQAWSQIAPPVADPKGSPTDVILSPETRHYSALESDEGDTLVVASVRYSDGTRVRHPAVAWLEDTPLPVEILFLDLLVPSPQIVRTQALLPGESKAEGLPRVRGEWVRELQRDLDFAPHSPFRLRLRQVQGFATLEAVTQPRDTWEPLAPKCLQNEWLGLARVRPPGDLAPRLTWGALEAALKGELSGTTPYFQGGAFVCVALETL